jgi:hypothetical protein
MHVQRHAGTCLDSRHILKTQTRRDTERKRNIYILILCKHNIYLLLYIYIYIYIYYIYIYICIYICYIYTACFLCARANSDIYVLPSILRSSSHLQGMHVVHTHTSYVYIHTGTRAPPRMHQNGNVPQKVWV